MSKKLPIVHLTDGQKIIFANQLREAIHAAIKPSMVEMLKGGHQACSECPARVIAGVLLEILGFHGCYAAWDDETYLQAMLSTLKKDIRARVVAAKRAAKAPQPKKKAKVH